MLRFTLQRDPDRRLSACADGPSGRDVDCRVHICVCPMAAGCAPEHRLALAVVRCAVPADTTGLRRVCRLHFLDPTRRLVLQASDQLAPSIGQDAAIESCFGAATVRQVRTWSFRGRFGLRSPGHLGDTQVLYPDDVESPGQVGAGLLYPILAAVTGTRRQLCDRSPHPLTTTGATTASRQSTLQMFEPYLFGRRQLRARQEFAGGKCRRDGDASIHADDLACTRSGDGWRDRGECDVPAARAVAGDPVRLGIRNGPGQPDPYPADLRHTDCGPLPAQLDHPGCLATDDTEAVVQSGSAPGRPPVRTAVEVPESLVEVAQRLLLHGLRPSPQPAECSPCLSQLPRLFREPGRGAFVASPHRPLLKGKVPDVSGVPALLQQRRLLRASRIQPKPGHGSYPISRDRQSLDFEGRQSRSLPALEGRAFPRPIR